MEDDDEIHSDSSSPSHNRRIAVTVGTAAAPPSIAPSPANSLTLALPIQRTPSSASGGREDCWSEGATAVLIDAWGERYLELSRGNLKQKHWKDVADIVDGREGYTKNPKTDVQCKNRIDTVKKKYKVERAKIAAGGPPSNWRFYHQLDQLIGPTSKTNSTPPSMADAANHHHLHHKAMHHKLPMGIPVGLRLHQKRSHKQELFDSDDESEPDNSVDSSDDLPPETSKRPRFQKALNLNNKSVVKHGFNKKSDAVNKESGLSRNWRNTMSELTQAIMRFGEAYEQAESAKLQQQVEMEKQRMKFTKDLELQRMQYFMKTQLELSRLKVKKPETNRSNNNNHHNVKSSNDINNNSNNNNNNNKS